MFSQCVGRLITVWQDGNFFNIWPFWAMKNCPIAWKIAHGKFKMSPSKIVQKFLTIKQVIDQKVKVKIF